jgi:hypothetical protein
VLEPAHAVDSIVVTSLEDDGTEGTLRWAITESNAGLTFDKITFSVSGTINLASSLPGITRNVTIEGPGEANLAIDGGDLYSGLVLQGRNMTIGGLTFSNMYNSNGQAGSAIWLVRGTVYVNNVTVTSSTTAIATKEGGSYIYINYGTFTGNTTALFSNHGGTPTTPSEDDNAYDNRIHVSNSLFESNNTAVYGERTILIDNSAFNNNSTAFLMRGLNKHRVVNSTFSGNSVGVIVSSYWPNFPGYLSSPYINTIITGNTFADNTTAISLNARHNNIYTQVGSSVSNNIWDEAGTFIYSSEGSSAFTDGLDAREGAEYYAINNTSSVPPPPEPSISAPTNLSVTVNQDGSVSLTWDASVVNETAYLNYYVIAWNIPGAGWAITTTNTYGTISASNFESTGGFDIEYSFKIRADDNDNAIYVWSESVDNVMVSVTGPSEEELAQAEADRLAAEKQAADDQAVADQQAAEQAKADRQAAAQAESDRQAAADAEAARQAAIKAEADRQTAIKAEADRVAAEEAAAKAAAEKAAAEEAARQKAIADAKAEADRLAAEKAAAEEVARLEAVAKAKADAAAAQAVAEAKAKADAEAKAKADAAAKVEADRIALAKAEADAKAKAKATADAKAKADALAKAEEDARLEAERVLEAEAALEGKEAVELEVPMEAAEVKEVIREISKIEEPRNLTTTQVAQITQLVNEVFASVEKDSEEYDAAREILAVLAEADDKELPKELAAIPILGNVAGEVLNVLNDLGNVGSDMAPEQRERSEETVVAAVIVGQVAQVATATAAAASAGASGGYRRRIK